MFLYTTNMLMNLFNDRTKKLKALMLSKGTELFITLITKSNKAP
ncbi:protein of unknown function [Tenacibaculum sp. 190524A02b]